MCAGSQVIRSLSMVGLVEEGRTLGYMQTLRRQEHLPVVRQQDEVAYVLAVMEGTPRLGAHRLYGSGLRLIATLRLSVQAIDCELKAVTVRSGRGGQRARADRGALHESLVDSPWRIGERPARGPHAAVSLGLHPLVPGGGL